MLAQDKQLVWAKEFLSLMLADPQKVDIPLRHPLSMHLAKLLIPEATANHSEALRWLGQLGYSSELDGLLAANGLPTNRLELFEMALALDPDDQLARTRIVTTRLEGMWHDYRHLTCACCPHPDQSIIHRELQILLAELDDLARFRGDDTLPELGASIDELRSAIQSKL